MSNETLLNQFNNLVDQYKSVYKQYTDSLEDDNLIVISDYSYQGTYSLSQVNMNSSNDCLTNCQNTTNCSGATFNSQNNKIRQQIETTESHKNKLNNKLKQQIEPIKFIPQNNAIKIRQQIEPTKSHQSPNNKLNNTLNFHLF